MKNPWVRNLWLLLAAHILLTGSLGMGPMEFRGAVRHLFLQYVPVFPDRLIREIQILYWVFVVVGIGCIAIYLWAGLSGRRFVQWLVGRTSDVRDTLRGFVLFLALANSAAFVTARVIRDSVRTKTLWGLSLEERKQVLFAENELERHYVRGQAFLKERDSDGNLVILRNLFDDEPGEYLRAEHLHYSAHMFPLRVYLVHAPHCDVADLPSGWVEARRIEWVIYDCNEKFTFDPKPLKGRDGV